MKKSALWGLAMAAISFTSSCDVDLDLPAELPACLQAEVQDPDALPEVVAIYEYVVDGETYFLLEAECCDAFNYLYDEECNQICAPSGGIAGGGTGDCPDWTGDPVQTLVWERESD